MRTDIIDGLCWTVAFRSCSPPTYPQVRKRIDVDALGLAHFEPGAVVRTPTGMHRVSDPLRRPKALPRTLLSRVASAPRRGPYLMLDGEGTGPALNVVVMSEVQRSYAPAGRALIAAAVPGRPALGPNLPSARASNSRAGSARAPAT